jgi:hypothetical protein
MQEAARRLFRGTIERLEQEDAEESDVREQLNGEAHAEWEQELALNKPPWDAEGGNEK